TRMAVRSSGRLPSRARRRTVSRNEKPQSTMTQVSPFSTRVALPRLPLPRELKRMLIHACGDGAIALHRELRQKKGQAVCNPPWEHPTPAAPAMGDAAPTPPPIFGEEMAPARRTLLQLLVQQGKDARCGGRPLEVAVLIQHHDARLSLSFGQADPILGRRRRLFAPERQLGQESLLFLLLERIVVTHIVNALRAVAVLHREAHPIQGNAAAPPGAVA